MSHKGAIFKNNAPFRSCKSKIKSQFIDNVEELDIAMPICNPLMYNDDFSMNQEAGQIVVEIKWIMLMIMFQMVNH